MEKPILVLNGPNLNLLGVREPHIYGRETLADVEALCRVSANRFPIEFRQSNHEGQLIEWVHEARENAAAIVINPAAYSFTSIALLDALKTFEGPIVEVHISNIHQRESHYHHSYVSLVAKAVIAGLGTDGYRVAVEALERLLSASLRPSTGR